MDILNFISGTGDFLLFLATLGFIIFVHELGHFMTAKWVGIRVEEFAIGFGPKLFSRKSGETEYNLRWLPLGGFVKMLGQDDLDPTKVSADPRAYNNKPVWQRMIVVSAGVVMNLIFGVIFFMVAFMWGVDFPPAITGNVEPGSPAALAVSDADPSIVGLQPGDRIVLVNGKKPSDYTGVRVEVALSTGEPIDIVVERPQGDGHAAKRLRFDIRPQTQIGTDLLDIGIAPPDSVVLDGEDAPPADRKLIEAQLQPFGLQPGMALAAVNGVAITEQWEYIQQLRQSGNQPIDLTFVDASGKRTNVEVTPLTQLQSRTTGEGETAAVVRHLAGLVPPVQIMLVDPGTPADGPLMVGDIVRRVGDVHWPTDMEVRAVVGDAGATAVEFEVLRDGEAVTVSVTPRGGKVGIGMNDAVESAYVIDVLDDSPFAGAGFVAGTRVTQIGGQAVNSYGDIRAALAGAASGGGEVEVVFVQPLLGGLEGEAKVSIGVEHVEAMSTLSWNDPIGMFAPLLVLQRAGTPWEAVALGFDKTGLFLQQTYVTLLRLVEGTIKPKHLSGPVGIAHIGTTMADRGMPYLLYFAGLISVNLAVINFLPFPIVDGGLFVMLMLEKVRGRPLPLEVQSAITTVGIVLLAGVFLFLTYNDLARLEFVQRLFGGG